MKPAANKSIMHYKALYMTGRTALSSSLILGYYCSSPHGKSQSHYIMQEW